MASPTLSARTDLFRCSKTGKVRRSGNPFPLGIPTPERYSLNAEEILRLKKGLDEVLLMKPEESLRTRTLTPLKRG
jgi:hypothetical protein